MDKTLIILGAGASKDFCEIFPTGIELIKEINYHFLTEQKYSEDSRQNDDYLSALMNDISFIFRNDIKLFKRIKNELWEIQLNYEYKSVRNDKKDPVSIDNFIARKIKERSLPSDAKNIIKYCIYYLIKGTEQALAEGSHNLNNSWINELAKKVSVGNDLNLIMENLTVITFNYDRTFEKYFPDALGKIIELIPAQISELQNSVKHVYGYLGDLNEISFESDNSKENLAGKYNAIELINDRNIELDIKNADQYKKVHFIGFGYDKENMDIINLKRFTSAAFHGSAYNYNESQISDLREKYGIIAKEGSCLNYIKDEF